jgi:hypothetical protein
MISATLTGRSSPDPLAARADVVWQRLSRLHACSIEQF